MNEDVTKQASQPTGQVANPWQRLLAYLVDLVVWILIVEGLVWIVATARTIDQLLGSLTGAVALLVFLSAVGGTFYVSAMTSWLGGTLGKLFVGIEVVNPSGQRVSFWRAFFRNYIGYMVSTTFFWLGFIWIFVDRKRRGWHDMIADTYVVVKHRLGYIMGIVVLLALLGISLLFGVALWQQISNNLPFYQEVFGDLIEEIKT